MVHSATFGKEIKYCVPAQITSAVKHSSGGMLIWAYFAATALYSVKLKDSRVKCEAFCLRAKGWPKLKYKGQ